MSTVRLPTFRPLEPVSTRAIEPPMVPLATDVAASLLTNTEKFVTLSSPATVASRSISERTEVNSSFSFVRSTDDECEAACVASVESRSSRFEMLLRAPSLTCRVDSASFALRMPWFSVVTVLR